MKKVIDELLAANEAYASKFDEKADLAAPPARRILILTCMDARLDPAKFAGLTEGDAHVVRNAGGRASDDAIRSMVISHKLLGTTDWVVIHHTECGLAQFTDDLMADLLSESLKTAMPSRQGFRNVEQDGGSPEGHYLRWLTIRDQTGALVEDVTRIRNHPLVNPEVAIYGYIYDVRTGRLNEVPEATAAGRPRA